MEWTDEAIVLNAAAHGEGAAIADVLTLAHGRRRGLVRGGRSSRRRGGLEAGNTVRATWRGRLPDQLGSLNCEVVTSVAAVILADAGRLAALRSACALLMLALPQHDPHPKCHAALTTLLASLTQGTDWPSAYARWEMALLADMGYGLDLARCAAGSDDPDLAYVSPRSGRAVGRAAGEPYRDKLLALPAFLIDGGAAATAAGMRQALRLTGYFLEKHVVTEAAWPALPAARLSLVRRFAASGD
jgi:DNA repair protein RecO (recombination protein O)